MKIRTPHSHNALAALVFGLMLSLPAQAALYDRGGGLLYDDVLNLTWLQDANYAKTSGYDTDGLMNWGAAKTWAENLVFHDSVRNADYSDWRLASNTPVGTDWNYSYSTAGTTDLSYNITSPHSELSYMYYVNLGLKGYYSPAGTNQPDFGIFGNGTIDGQNNVGPVKNLQSPGYWSGTAYAPYPADDAWVFVTIIGGQGNGPQGNELYAWAVRPGDVAAVPEPEAYALMLVGMGLLAGVARRKQK